MTIPTAQLLSLAIRLLSQYKEATFAGKKTIYLSSLGDESLTNLLNEIEAEIADPPPAAVGGTD